MAAGLTAVRQEYVRVPFADTGLSVIPECLSYEDALFAGDILSSGYFGAELADIHRGDTVAVIGAGPVGLCASQCAKVLGAGQVIVWMWIPGGCRRPSGKAWQTGP